MQLVRDCLFHHGNRQRHAPLPGASAGGVHDALRGALQGGIAHDQRVVLCLGQGLHPLAVGGRGGIDVLPDGGGADERDSYHVGMAQQYLGLRPRTGDEVQNALGKPCLLPQLHDAHGGARDEARGLEHHGVACRYAQRRHPTHGDHRGEVPRGDPREHAQGLQVLRRVVPGGGVHDCGPLDEMRDSGRVLHYFNHLEHVPHGLVPDLAVLLGYQVRELIHVAVQDALHPKQNLRPLVRRHVRPGGESSLCRGNCSPHLLRSALRSARNDLPDGRIVAVHVMVGLRGLPLSADPVFQFLRLDSCYHVDPPCIHSAGRQPGVSPPAAWRPS